MEKGACSLSLALRSSCFSMASRILVSYSEVYGLVLVT